MSGIVWDWDRCWVHAQRFAYVVACLLKAGAMGGAYKCDRRSLLFLSPEKRGGDCCCQRVIFQLPFLLFFHWLTDWLSLSLSFFFIPGWWIHFPSTFGRLKRRPGELCRTVVVELSATEHTPAGSTHSSTGGGSGSQSGSPFRSPRLCEFGKLVAFAASWIVTL